MRVHEVVTRAVVSEDTSVVFGLMGDANMLYVVDLMEAGVRYVGGADERNCVMMAAAYARAADQVGVATVTHGPALTNAITTLTEAARAKTPLVLLTGDTPWVPDYVQELDIRGAIATTGAGYERVLGAAYTTSTVARAFRRARTERRPVVVDIPYDLLELEPPDTDAPARKPGQSFPVTRPDPAAVEEALGALLGARRPILIAGRGAVSSGAHDVLVELADLLSMPVATSMLAKDFFRGHPLNLGTCGSVAMSTAIDRIAGADCVIAFGASLNQYTADRGRLLNRDKRIIQVDTAPENVGQYLDADITVAGDAAQVATALVELVRGSGVELPKRSEERLRATLASASPQDEFKDGSTEDLLDVRTALVTLDRVLPEARNVVTDVGRFMQTAWKYVHVPDPRRFVHTANFGSIGLGLGATIGVAAAWPDCPTVAVVGDGGLMQAVSELATIARHRLPVVVVVADDGAYGAEWRKLQGYGIDPKYSLVAWPDFAAVAQAMGMEGYTARTVADLSKLEPLLSGRDRPVLIDVKINPAVDI